MGVALGKLSLYAAIRLISRRNLNPVEKAHNNRTFGSLKVKDLSRFINMIILRLFATARRIAIFR